jgi:L-Ala-D/L-Glu epimerase
VRVESAELLVVRMPLLGTYAHARATFRYAEALLLRLVSDGMDGWGEAQPRAYVTGETVSGVFREMSRVWPVLREREIHDVGDVEVLVAAALETLTPAEAGTRNAARCLLETALLDLWARTQELDLAEALGLPACPPVKPVCPVGLPGGAAAMHLSLGFGKRLGLGEAKIRVENDLSQLPEVIGEVKRCLGEQVRIGIDANGTWSVAELGTRCGELVDAGVDYLEQPLPPGQEDALVGLPLKIALDESILGLGDVERCHELGACQIYTIKVGKVGGLFAALRIVRWLRERRAAVIVSTHVGETPILESLGAMLLGEVRPLFNYEGGAFQHVVSGHPFRYQSLWGADGVSRRKAERGTGVEIDDARLGQFVVERVGFGRVQPWTSNATP